MADLVERMETIEAYIKVLSEEKMESKMQTKKLEARLERSEKKIQELEQRQEQPDTDLKCGFKKSELKKMEKRLADLEQQQQRLQEQVQEKPRQEIRCGFNKAEFKEMKRRLSDLERQQERLKKLSENDRVKFEKIDKLQYLLNNMMLKRQQTCPIDSMENKLDSRNDKCADLMDTTERISKQMDNVKKMMDSVDKELEEQRQQLPWQFHSVMAKVSQHKVASSLSEFEELAGLEKLAGVEDGPAFKFVTNAYGDDSDWGERRRQRHVEELRKKGVSTPGLAMREFIYKCGHQTTGETDTLYYPVWWDGSGVRRIILAINRSHLRLLDEDTKKEIESWPSDAISQCQLDEYDEIQLTFSSGKTETFCAHESINQDVVTLTRSLMKK